MNLTMKLTFDGLVRALRWKGIALKERASLSRADGRTVLKTESGAGDDGQRGSIAEGAV
ncbi:MAG: hypothetical protein J0H18_11035 [Rhizobiales bacterium]|nr:hypothetical protein [Hyphomicrobiales bacterium]